MCRVFFLRYCLVIVLYMSEKKLFELGKNYRKGVEKVILEFTQSWEELFCFYQLEQKEIKKIGRIREKFQKGINLVVGKIGFRFRLKVGLDFFQFLIKLKGKFLIDLLILGNIIVGKNKFQYYLKNIMKFSIQ